MRPQLLAALSLAVLLLGGFAVSSIAAPSAVAPSVAAWIGSATPDDHLAVWVFLTDKGEALGDVTLMIDKVARAYDPSAVERRLRARPGRPFDKADLPLYKPYLDALKSEGVRFRAFSRWLNAASVVATPAQLERIQGMPFVRSLRRVSGMAGAPRPETWETSERPTGALYQYGQAYTQLTQIQVPQLHDDGYIGTGIKIAILDTGFWLQHEVFASLHKIAEHDFINNDDVTANQPGDPAGQHDHGTMCLSLLAANKPGTMMGAAFDADYILAKTEDIADEQPVEEDYWIAAAEWADSLGAQVISTSLGYIDWYTYADMDGNTAPITIAADLAASNGIIVVAAAGNEGASEWKYIMAPADGDSVIAAGAVDSLGTRSYFSSQGPTYDGRIKPTIMAMGQADYIASPTSPTSYRRGSGTSFATPLTAGALALVLEKHPNWLPGNMIEAVTATGSQASNPDTLCGWGILRAYDASNYAPSGVATPNPVGPKLQIYPNPCRTSFSIVSNGLDPRMPVLAYDASGRLIRRLDLVPSGLTKINLDSALPGVAPGIIFLEAPGATTTKVLILK